MEIVKYEHIENKIFTIRNIHVMNESELAELFQVKIFAKSHDHFLLIDQTDLYHIGASLQDLGKKPVVSEVESWFAFSRMDSMTGLLLNQLNNLK